MITWHPKFFPKWHSASAVVVIVVTVVVIIVVLVGQGVPRRASLPGNGPLSVVRWGPGGRS